MAECSSCVICETTFCVTICVVTSQERKDKKKEEGMEKKDRTGEVVNSIFKMPFLHKSLVLTGHPQSLALPRPVQGTMGWCSAPEQGGNTWIFQGSGFPISNSCSFCFCLAASWLAASLAVSMALCQEQSGFKRIWDAGVGMSSKGPPGRNALRKESLQTTKLGLLLSLAAQCNNTASRELQCPTEIFIVANSFYLRCQTSW